MLLAASTNRQLYILHRRASETLQLLLKYLTSTQATFYNNILKFLDTFWLSNAV